MNMRRSWCVRACGLLLLAAVVPGARAFQEGSRPPTQLEQAAIVREKAVWRAAAEGNKGAFTKLVDEDARMIFTSGVMTRQQYLDSSSERKITDYELSDFQVLAPNDKTIIIIYNARISGVFRGKQSSYSVRECSVWVRKKTWVAVLNQETPN